jgi:branched-subunit amino acid aminotransferase/4-amino-4-deoxychorismate lyase
MNDDIIDSNSLLVQYGLGAFETMRCVASKIPLQHFHLERILKAASVWGIEKNTVEQEFLKHFKELPTELSRIKVLIGLNDENTLVSHRYTVPLIENLDPKNLVMKKTNNREAEYFKSCNYAFHYFERKKAIEAGYDDVCYQQEGRLIECSTSAIILINEGSGMIANGENLSSVSVAKLMSLKGDYWSKGPVVIDGLQQSGQLCVANALHGLTAIRTIKDETGNLLYENKTPKDISHWNELLFSDE